MLKHKKIKLGRKYIEGIRFKLFTKNLIVLKGSKGYIMCGYLDLKVAEKFGDVAVKIVGVSDIQGTLNSRVFDCSRPAKKLGIYKGQPVKEALRIIA